MLPRAPGRGHVQAEGFRPEGQASFRQVCCWWPTVRSVSQVSSNGPAVLGHPDQGATLHVGGQTLGAA